MGFDSVFKKAAKTAVKIFESIGATVTYYSYGTSSYDPTSGNAPTDPTGTQHVLNGVIFTDFKETEIDNVSVFLKDKKALLPSLNISFIPKKDDLIVQDSNKWEVQSAKVDPAGALWIVHVRLGGST